MSIKNLEIFNTMLKKISGIAIALISIGSSLTFTDRAIAEEIACQGTLGAITVDNVKVPQGKTCTLKGTTVKGGIVVNRNATLKAIGAKVNGNIQAEGAALVDVNSSATVGGSIQVKQGNRARVVSTRIKGDLQFESNSGAIIANQNRIDGNLQAFQNTGGVTVRQNRIDENLQCKQNNPKPVGGGNIVQGSKEDQCAKL
jgi:hypothetical protein